MNQMHEHITEPREIDAAIAYIQRMRFDALVQKRAYSKRNNPFAPLPGMEVEYRTACTTVNHLNRVLKELEKNSVRRARRNLARTLFTGKVIRRFLEFLIYVGVFGTIIFGIALLCFSFRCHPAVACGIILCAALATELCKHKQ